MKKFAEFTAVLEADNSILKQILSDKLFRVEYGSTETSNYSDEDSVRKELYTIIRHVFFDERFYREIQDDKAQIEYFKLFKAFADKKLKNLDKLFSTEMKFRTTYAGKVWSYDKKNPEKIRKQVIKIITSGSPALNSEWLKYKPTADEHWRVFGRI